MSSRSPNTRQLITAGLVGVGVGVLAAGIGYAIVNRSPTNNLNQPTERKKLKRDNTFDREGTKQNLRAIEYNENSDQCKICGIDITSEPSVLLNCNHSFHRKCLFSNYIVQIQVNKSATFQCPVNDCKAEIPDRIVESLIVHQ